MSVDRLKARMAAFFLTDMAERGDLNPQDIQRPNAANKLIFRHQDREYNVSDLVRIAIQMERTNSGSTASDDDVAALLLGRLNTSVVPDS